ncbi:MAG: LacI family transcriptional regulator [Treponema sp.]|nr:LacI family transcriptional regulator [Treponema sp.]
MPELTIHDIAREANVSISTVSRVMNNTKKVSPEIKERVFSIIEKHNFKPNQIARGLVSRKSGMIAVIIPDISNAVFGSVTKGIESICQQKDYTLIVSESGGNTDNELNLLRAMSNRQIDGLLFAGVDVHQKVVDAIDEQKYSTVLVMQEMSEPSTEKSIPTIIHDNIQAIKDATRFLYEKGHRDIAFIGGLKNDFSAGKKRYMGYCEVMSELNLQYNDSYVEHGDFSFESGYRCMQKIHEKNKQLPSAVMVCSDLMAIGAMNYLDTMNIKVPEEISIMGFDDIEMASYVKPQLSTIRIPYFEEGALAARTLFSLMEEEELLLGTQYIPHKIIERQSVRSVLI